MKFEHYYEEAGSGYPLILLHGNSESAEYFRHQIDYFSEEYRVIAVDTRGHGRSPRGDGPFSISRFADDLNGEARNRKSPYTGVFRRGQYGSRLRSALSTAGKQADLERSKSVFFRYVCSGVPAYSLEIRFLESF